MSKTRRPAILVYSKTGHTARVARALADISDAEIVPIEVDRYRVPGLWMARGILDIAWKSTPPLKQDLPDIAGRPWVVVAGPIWAAQPVAPVRTVLASLSDKTVPVGLLSTSGEYSAPEKAYASARKVLGRNFVATVDIHNAIEGSQEMTDRLDTFAKKLRASATKAAE